MASTLTPPPIEARAQPRKPLPFGFGPRFFIALFAGLLWLLPAWWFHRLIVAMLLSDTFVVAAWLFDLLRLPAPSELDTSRIWAAPLTLASPASITMRIQNCGHLSVLVTVIDQTPVSLRDEPPTLSTFLPLGTTQQLQYSVLPRERGDMAMGKTFVRYRSAFGLAERWCVVPLEQTVCVFSDLTRAEDQSLHVMRSRQIEMRKRQRRQLGIGREFESLREYRRGDELRDVSWTATARRHQIITRTYTAERSQTVWLVLDAGRLLRAQVRGDSSQICLSKLDYAVNAALSLAQAASQNGDRIGLLAYGRSIQRSILPGRGPLQISRFVEALAQVRSESGEANHSLAARALLQKQARRALVVWLTDFAETPATPDVIEYAARLGKRNLVLFAAIAQPDLFDLAFTLPESEAEMFRHAAALEIVQRRDLLLRELRQAGVLALELAPGRVTVSLINEYLRIKDRNLL